MSLFRPEAIEAKSKSGMGEVIIVQPRIFWLMTALFLLLTAIAVAVAVIGQFSRKETVLGYLAPREGVAAIHAQRGGIVTEILIEEGDEVARGQVLIRLTTDPAANDGEASLQSQIEQLDRRREEARLQLEATDQRFSAETERLEDRVRGLQDEIEGLSRRLALARESEAIAAGQMERWTDLGARGLAPAVEVEARRQAYISAQISRSDIERTITERRGDVRDARHALALMPVERDLALSRARAEINALEQSRRELTRAAGYALTAPVAGRVSALQAVEGATVRPERPLAAILPEGAQLRAHLLAPTRASGFVEPGQSVRLRVDAFPYQRFGSVEGRITDMSASVLSPLELAAPVPVQEPVYRLTVDLSAQSVAAYGAEQPLQAGMTLQADILVDRRPLWRWFIDPVLALRGG
ncbi:MAG: HlyD family efflux transporter periplasmic adaptor subunit [Pseudomonadota bacterium]